MNELDKNEKTWILICKGHLQDKYPQLKHDGNWCNIFKPFFTEIYGWNPDKDNNYHDYLDCLFRKLLSIFMKIKEERSNTNPNLELEDLFRDVFYKTKDTELPIERGIIKLRSLISNTSVINNDGSKRFDLK